MSKTFIEESQELREALLDLIYEFYKGIGVTWLAKKMHLGLRDWVKEREAT